MLYLCCVVSFFPALSGVDEHAIYTMEVTMNKITMNTINTQTRVGQIIILLCLAVAALVGGFVVAILNSEWPYVSRTVMGLGVLVAIAMTVPAILLINRQAKQNEDRITRLELIIESLEANDPK